VEALGLLIAGDFWEHVRSLRCDGAAGNRRLLSISLTFHAV